MFVQVRKITVTEGNAAKIVERFSKPSIIEEQDGFVELQIMVKKNRRGEEEVMVCINWESEEYWKQWEKSDAHIAGHKAKGKQPKPDYMINVEVGTYEVKAVKKSVKSV